MLRELPAAASAKLGASTSMAQLRTIVAIRNRRMMRLSLLRPCETGSWRPDWANS
jgi:hypothetical protein